MMDCQIYAFMYSGLMKSDMFFGLGWGFSVPSISNARVRKSIIRAVVVVTVVVRVRILGRANVVHLVCRATLHAAGNRLLAGKLDLVTLCS